jgi:diketogulonate reductase-like aldo/keto reductase
MNRRQSLHYLAACGSTFLLPSIKMANDSLIKRSIPSTNETLPAIGLGTWQTFDVSTASSDRAPLSEVLQSMHELGGRVIDSSPMYGNSERVVGDLSTELNLNKDFFIATKVWTSGKEAGIRQMNESFKLLQRKTIDLMQVHNLVDWKSHFETLRAWKEEKRIRYIGITHYLDSAHSTVEQIIKENKIDFIQINYSLGSRNAEKRLLPAAAERGVAVLINRPFEEGALFNAVKGKTLPSWASEFDCKSWGQFFLKFIISNPHVTCAIPGTSRAKHLIDNLGAAMGRLPDEKQRQKMIEVLA